MTLLKLRSYTKNIINEYYFKTLKVCSVIQHKDHFVFLNSFIAFGRIGILV